jgi:hypothetical protein
MEKCDDVLDALCTSEKVFDADEADRLRSREATSRCPSDLYAADGGRIETVVTDSGLAARLMVAAVCKEMAETGLGSSSASNGET